MKWITKFLAWLKKGKVSVWKSTDEELSDSTRPKGATKLPDGKETYTGVKVTLPM